MHQPLLLQSFFLHVMVSELEGVDVALHMDIAFLVNVPSLTI